MSALIKRQVLIARKPHVCGYCLFNIKKGEVYNRDFLRGEDGVFTWKSHINCDALANKLNFFDSHPDGLDFDGFEWSVDEAYYSDVQSSNIPVPWNYVRPSIVFNIKHWHPSFKHKLNYLINKHLR